MSIQVSYLFSLRQPTRCLPHSPSLRTISAILLCVILASTAPRGDAFALLGPFKNRANHAPDPWQGKPYGGRPGGLGYELSGDIGGPMFINEAYRWNIPVIYYGFDKSFVNYFGQAGIDAIEQAIAILNALPPASEMSTDLAEFPFDTKRSKTGADNLMDLKSYALALLLEQLGLANPERFVWGLRFGDYDPDFPENSLVMLNYDPVTQAPSRFVNGIGYNFTIFENLGPRGEEWASAVEWYQLDPQYQPYSSVANGPGSSDLQLGSGPGDWFGVGLSTGQFYTGLTRDDVGGLRFLLRRDNKVWEPLLPGVTGAGTNTSNFVGAALRGGVEKLTFARLMLDTTTGHFAAVTNFFSDVYFTNDVAVTQTLQRVVTRPDILFTARDLNVEFSREWFGDFYWAESLRRTDVSHWQNNNVLNQQAGAGGPGIIHPGAQITFNTLGRLAFARDRELLRFAPYLLQWASFDGSSNPPVPHFGPLPSENQFHLATRITVIDGIGSLQSTFHGEYGRTYRIDRSTNLVDWTRWYWRDNYEGIFSIDHPIDGSHRFLRIVREQWPW